MVAIQHLPPKTRAVLILRDVLDWPAKDTAALLETSVAAVNSALQRARAGLKEHLPERRLEWAPGADPTEAQRELLERYIEASDRADAHALAALMREDSTWSMPPEPGLWRGRDAIVGELARGRHGHRRVRPLPLRGDVRQPPARGRLLPPAGPARPSFRALALDVLRIEEGEIADITSFTSVVFPAFGLPADALMRFDRRVVSRAARPRARLRRGRLARRAGPRRPRRDPARVAQRPRALRSRSGPEPRRAAAARPPQPRRGARGAGRRQASAISARGTSRQVIGPIASRSARPGSRSPPAACSSRGGAGSPNSRCPNSAALWRSARPGLRPAQPPARGHQRRRRARAPSASAGTAGARAGAGGGRSRTGGLRRWARGDQASASATIAPRPTGEEGDMVRMAGRRSCRRGGGRRSSARRRSRRRPATAWSRAG